MKEKSEYLTSNEGQSIKAFWPTYPKEVVRHAFKDYLPQDVLWRRKEAFSDGVSSTQKSWYEIIQETLSKQHQPMIERKHVCPYDIESSYYRQVFEARYGQTHAEVIPRFWKQPFTTVVDPSARCLSNYESDNIRSGNDLVLTYDTTNMTQTTPVLSTSQSSSPQEPSLYWATVGDWTNVG